MDLLRAFFLGVIQALTEFLPISSSAHLILFRRWLGFEAVDGLTFDVALHVGTLCAVVVYFRRDLLRLIRLVFDRDAGAQRRLPWLIAAATVPAAVAGVVFSDLVENVLRNPTVIVATLIVGGILFLVVERISTQARRLDDVDWKTAMTIGVAQALALVPGVSRSGITITAGMFLGLSRTEAARFSFLLSVPILLGAGLKKGLDVDLSTLGTGQLLELFTGAVTSAVVGWLVIGLLLRFLRSRRLDGFAYYRFVLAAVVALLLMTGWA